MDSIQRTLLLIWATATLAMAAITGLIIAIQ